MKLHAASGLGAQDCSGIGSSSRDSEASTVASSVAKPMHCLTDLIPLVISDLQLHMPNGRRPLRAAYLEAHQGSMVAVVGPHKAGKGILMRLLAGIIPPSEGSIFIPAHLNVLHVTQEPMILETGLWGNLTFGVDTEPEHVRSVLRLMEEWGLLDQLDKELQVCGSDTHAQVMDDDMDNDDDADNSAKSDRDASAVWRRQLSYTE